MKSPKPPRDLSVAEPEDFEMDRHGRHCSCETCEDYRCDAADMAKED